MFLRNDVRDNDVSFGVEFRQVVGCHLSLGSQLERSDDWLSGLDGCSGRHVDRGNLWKIVLGNSPFGPLAGTLYKAESHVCSRQMSKGAGDQAGDHCFSSFPANSPKGSESRLNPV